ncbi:UTP--glucose-1-phosphate uridylyltransferase [Akkermansiaceae bacterium]|nr:UTP--glucose-1-phosphate uridylyltransferase [Akkermansiaceae bacterium]
MEKKGVIDLAIRSFEKSFQSVVGGASGTISESDISPAKEVLNYKELTSCNEFDSGLLGQTAIIKLNGGLGTSMGLEKVKSLLEVRPGVNFLDLMARQVLSLRAQSGQEVRFLLMNSQASSEDTLGHLSAAVPQLGGADDLELMQSWAPKLRRDDFEPVSHPENPDLEWCPPGHADVYPSLVGSGWLDRLLSEGVKYAFVSNSDNLGAVLDPTLLTYFAQTGAPFLMEVTRRTDADRKGGHLAKRKSDGRLVLREVAQCAEGDMKSFQDIERHQFFNTNNVWLNLEALRDVLAASDGVFSLPVIQNAKTVDPRDGDSASVYQLETAMGSAIECFDGALAVNVPRSRFAPVKSTADLLALRSDAYELSEDGQIKLAPSRNGVPPVVKLAPEYKMVDSLEGLGVPSLIGAEEVSISGRVSFDGVVEVVGKVAFGNNGGDCVKVPPGVYQDEAWSAI